MNGEGCHWCILCPGENQFLNRVQQTQDGEGNGNPLQYSCLETPMEAGAWQAAVQGVMKSQIRQSDFTFTFHFHALEKEMVTHSNFLAWRIPGTGEPSGLPSMGVAQSWTQLKRLRSSSSSSRHKIPLCLYMQTKDGKGRDRKNIAD